MLCRDSNSHYPVGVIRVFFSQVLLQIEQMTQFRVSGDTHFLLCDYLFHLFLDGSIVGLDGTFHNIIAVFVNEIGNDGRAGA